MLHATREETLVRELARRVAELASREVEAEKASLWTACNELRPVRPMVFMDPQNGWRELEEAWLRLECEDSFLRGIECTLRLKLLRAAHLPDDFPITAVYPVHLLVRGTSYDDYGIPVQVEHPAERGGAYHIVRLLEGEEDLGRLHPRPIEVEHTESARLFKRTQELLGDLLDVRLRGKTAWRYGLTRVLVHLRGLDQMMLDMYDNPGLLHRIMTFLRDEFLREIDVMEREGAVSLNNTPDNVTGSGGLTPTSSIPAPQRAGSLRARDCICWGESQETVGVSPGQFEEFVLRYQLPLLRRFALTDYGCCEPLDRRLDLLIRSVPNLRWVSISPWAKPELCAEKLAGRYVYVFKPNPAYLCSPQPAWEQAEREIRRALQAARGQPIHIVMKDTNTFHYDAPRATRWCELARRLAIEAAA